MIAAGNIVKEVLEATVRGEDPEFVKRVWSVLNAEYYKICSAYSIHKLRDVAELDFSSAEAAGIILPGDLMGIDAIRDQDYGQRFYERDRGDIDPDEDGYRATRFAPETDDEFFARDLRLNNGANTFTSAALTADGTDYTDDYVRFGTEPGFYKLTAAMTFEPRYWGPRLSGEDFRIRPKETEYLSLFDDAEELWTEGTVDVHYWRAPQPLYRDSDVIALADSDWLELRVLRKLPEAKERRPVSQSALEKAEKTLLAKTPSFSIDKPRRDRQKNVFGFKNTGYYDRRG